MNNSVVQPLRLQISGELLQPGDHLQLTLARDGSDASDSCAEGMTFYGIVAYPSP